MTVRVIHKSESVIYKKGIYRFGDEFHISTTAGNSLIDRGYVEKVSDTPEFEETPLDRVLITDSASGEEYQVYVQNGQAYIEKVGA